MISSIDHVVFVYQKKTKPFNYKCIYHDDKPLGEGWVHTATINAAIWIEYFLNHPKERESQIKSISL